MAWWLGKQTFAGTGSSINISIETKSRWYCMKSETLVLVITDLNIFLSVLFNTDSMSK